MSIMIDSNVLYAGITTVIAVGSTSLYWSVKYGRKINPFVRQFAQFIDDWQGTPDRPGFDGHPGMAVRMQRQEQRALELTEAVDLIRRELVANGGGSLRDQVRRVEQAQRAIAVYTGAPEPLPLPAAELAALAVVSEKQRTAA